jgi:hypothetical protein
VADERGGNSAVDRLLLARGSEKVLARSYCRNPKLKTGEPFLIRLEAEHNFDPKEASVELVRSPQFIASNLERPVRTAQR